MAKDRESRPLSRQRGQAAGSKGLSDEERALWEHTARSLKPLKSRKLRVTGAQEILPEPAPPRPPAPKKAAPAPAQQPKPAPARLPERAPQPAALDRRTTRQIGSGRMEIEARIDLHGMRQDEAHAALRRFLLKAHAADKRLVLVITGKGGPARGQDELGYEVERGVLRRNVPRWLEEPELGSIVIGFSPAAVHHGGEGALYVRLRKRHRSARDR